MAAYRALTSGEIAALEENRCMADDWTKVTVADPFRPEHYRFAEFRGNVKLGTTDGSLKDIGGIKRQCGIYDAVIENCEIGHDVRINKVGNTLTNYHIGDNVHISNVGSMMCNGITHFGNGVKINVMDETGGRAGYIYDGMTSQVAYLMTLWRHDMEFVEILKKLILDYTSTTKQEFAQVGKNTRIFDTNIIFNVNIADKVKIHGASSLVEGTIGSRSMIGVNVIARNFIISTDARVDHGANVRTSYIGQGCHIDYGFTSAESMFFANCSMECGEAASVYCGPHAVSAHKASLLIGGHFSFFNAGSGTNQSNHLYRLGAMHHGVLEHGCKTGSNAYILWPAHIGAFTIVAGSHGFHPDTLDLPYSYLVSQNGRSFLLPATNLKTAGTMRDLLKWPERDRRSDDIPRHDLICYESLTPMVVMRMHRAIEILEQIEQGSDYADRHNFIVDEKRLRTGRELYALGIDYFVGEGLVEKLMTLDISSDSDWRCQLQPVCPVDIDQKWMDLGGMVTTVDSVEEICRRVKCGDIGDIHTLHEELRMLHSRYADMRWAYVVAHIERIIRGPISGVTPRALMALVERWSETVMNLDQLRREDAVKEFSPDVCIAFGGGFPDEYAEADFDAVRGTLDRSPQFQAMHRHYSRALLDAHEVYSRIARVAGDMAEM